MTRANVCIHAHMEVYGVSYMSSMRGSYLLLHAPRQGRLVRRPVDYVAAGITGVLSHHRGGFDAYHMVNPHWDDGVSLDTIVGWLAEARRGVRRIQDYGQWCAPLKAQPVVPAGTCLLVLLLSQALVLDLHTGQHMLVSIIYCVQLSLSPAWVLIQTEHGAVQSGCHHKLYGGVFAC